jgi:carbonic anhydrase/acetyltransferase-like protein (isoleucine patch superfamily)
LDNATVNSNSLIAAGALVKEGFVVPEGVLVAGVPGKIIRDLTKEEIEKITENSNNYVKYLTIYRSQLT